LRNSAACGRTPRTRGGTSGSILRRSASGTSPRPNSVLREALSLAEQEGVEDPYAIAVIRLLIFTGCRLNEIMTLKWSYVDFKARCLRLPDLKTGARIVHLGAPALEVFARLGRVREVLQKRRRGGVMVCG
jgi:integrase